MHLKFSTLDESEALGNVSQSEVIQNSEKSETIIVPKRKKHFNEITKSLLACILFSRIWFVLFTFRIPP